MRIFGLLVFACLVAGPALAQEAAAPLSPHFPAAPAGSAARPGAPIPPS